MAAKFERCTAPEPKALNPKPEDPSASQMRVILCELSNAQLCYRVFGCPCRRKEYFAPIL